MTAPHLRDRYLQDSITTASPAKLLLMLYDRLVLDLMQAEEALRSVHRMQEQGWVSDPEERERKQNQRAEERTAANERLTHAQEIVLELRTSLDVDAWSGAPALANLYGWMLTELIGANINKDADRVAACRALVEPLRDTWREAAAAAVAG
ncbi:flagellar export chaperone FliS [Paractinoplanes rhizophilus]|jgi:flagellar protein FliS|uniref:Flagellar export chaperone FliS n=1 Tax=Paractinoplanes rhizophilus TaxID=1416877 RepID=A0ABW2HLB9_9ACTN|nr:flagellar export chaperone FliS [Actinoplanes sp.]